MTNTSVEALIDVAEHRGYRVRWHKRGPKAAWIPPHTISLRDGMTDVATLCALAHELGHAEAGDPPGHTGAAEIRADRFAARLLIDPVEYKAAELIYGPHPTRLAAELGVTVHILSSWQTLYEDAELTRKATLSTMENVALEHEYSIRHHPSPQPSSTPAAEDIKAPSYTCIKAVYEGAVNPPRR